MDEVFAKYDTARSLFRELMNILLLCTHDSNYYYCYCKAPNKCTLCEFCDYFPDAKIDNIPIKSFLELNRNQKDKLDTVVRQTIKPFFDKVKSENQQDSLQFFNKEYYWHSRDIATGTIKHVSLDEIIGYGD